MHEERLPPPFVQYACDILADTNSGLSGPNIAKAMTAYAVEYDIAIPHPTYPFETPNKRSALFDNLMAFDGKQQYLIIKALCDHPSFSLTPNPRRKELKLRLATRYAHLAGDGVSEVNETLIEETRHWLNGYPEALELFNQALTKYDHGIFHRNLLDDLRLALEKLLHGILDNDKSLENQLKYIGPYIQDRGGSKELANMFARLLDYYTKYHNSYIKHDDAVIEEEIEFTIEITSSFMKHLIRLAAKVM